MQSEQLDGSLEKLSGRDSTVLFLYISINKSFSYHAIALTDGSITEFGEELVGIVLRNDLYCKFFSVAR